MANLSFKVGDVVKFSPTHLPLGNSPRFVVEPSTPDMIACRCIYTGGDGDVRYSLGSLYFAPPNFLVRCPIKDKFKGREFCEGLRFQGRR